MRECGENSFIAGNFYLTGGTALSAFYLHHRYSEDLDFFSEREVDVLAIDTFLHQAKKQLSITKIDFQQSYNRNLYFLHLKNEILKLEFTFFPFMRIEEGRKEYGIQIDSLLDIAVNKVFTIYQKPRARDYIDLFFVCKKKGFEISDLIAKAKIKFDWHIDPLQLATQFVAAEKAEDEPGMIKKVDDGEWKKFFVYEARKFRKQILE